MTFTPILAEISDKMPGVSAIWFWSLCLAAVGVGCCRFSRWLYLVALPVAGWLAFAGYGEIVAEGFFRDAIISELGHGYLFQAVCASWLPLVALLVCGIYDLRRRPFHSLERTAGKPAVAQF
jgi:hypothetical protein